MKERPILFSAPMVRAILAGHKTVTRRAVTPQPTLETDDWILDTGGTGKWMASGPSPATGGTRQTRGWKHCPFGQPGERLYVRETWSDVNLQGAPGIAYRADDEVLDLMEDETFLDDNGAFNYDDPRSKPYQFSCWSEDLMSGTEGRWRPSIHMPRWASRILLEITDVRVERLQDGEGETTYESRYLAEGINRIHHGDGDYAYHALNTEPMPGNWSWPEDAFKDLWNSLNGTGAWDSNPWAWVVEFKRVKP
ncbi:hypothetical protein [Pseudomonas jessenii]|uniref:hypothetical protein n=1 Tax=Pseudomonas jessenii TaxID=77298 RepID=UPI003892A939